MSSSTMSCGSRLQSLTVLGKKDIFLVSIRQDSIWNALLCVFLERRQGGISLFSLVMDTNSINFVHHHQSCIISLGNTNRKSVLDLSCNIFKSLVFNRRYLNWFYNFKNFYMTTIDRRYSKVDHTPIFPFTLSLKIRGEYRSVTSSRWPTMHENNQMQIKWNTIRFGNF